MEDNTTVEIGGTEFDADDLEDAIDAAEDDFGDVNRREGGHAIVGTVAVWGDTYNDNDVHVARLEDVTSLNGGNYEADDSVWTNTSIVRNAIEEGCEDPFDPVAYVEDMVMEANTVEKNCIGDNNVGITYAHIAREELEPLEDDDAISFRRIMSAGNKVTLRVGVDPDAAAE